MKFVTSVVNSPLFVELQYHCFAKWCQEPYEFIVFNDAKTFPCHSNFGDTTLRSQIEDVCKRFSIKHILIPETRLDGAALSCAHAMNFMTEYMYSHPDVYMVIDSDMFLFAPFTVEKYANYTCVIVPQIRGDIIYPWNGLGYFDTRVLPKTLNWNVKPGCDVGGCSDIFLKSLNSYGTMTWFSSCTWNSSNYTFANKKLQELVASDPRNQNNMYFMEVYDYVFLHYRAGGNWMRDHQQTHFDLRTRLADALACKMATVVSAFYVIPSKFPKETYYQWIYNFLHYIPCHLVLFTTEDLIPLFTTMRSPWMDRTRFIAFPMDKWKAWERYGREFWEKQHTLDHEAFRHSPELYAIWYEKKEFVLRAAELNVWGHSNYIWCDAGAFRDLLHIDQLTSFGTRWHYNNRMTLLQIEPFTEQEWNTGRDSDLRHVCRVGGGVQASTYYGWKQWSTTYDKMIEYMTLKGMFVGKDQNVMGCVVLNNANVVMVPSDDSVGDKWFTLLYYL